MIPKIVHYCWFGDKEMPVSQKQNVERWKSILTDYTFKCWTEADFDVDANPFTKEAKEAGKWAFVADYVRLHALYTMGGIYMDTDVVVKKSFDDYLDHSFFTSYEFHPKYREYDRLVEMLDENGKRKTELPSDLKIPGVGLMSAIFASESGHSFVRDCMSMYNMSFEENRRRNYTIPTTLAITAEKYGFRYVNEKQELERNICIYPSDVFADYRTSSSSSVAVHECTGSWKHQTVVQRIKVAVYKKRWCRRFYMKVRNLFEKNPLVY